MLATRIALAALLFAPSSARAQADGGGADPLTEGLAAYEALDYPRAVELLEQALEANPPREQAVIVHRTLAFCHLALDQDELARVDLQLLLELDPHFDLDRSVAPRLRAALEEARAALGIGKPTVPAPPPRSPPLAPELSPERPTAGRPLAVRVRSEAPGAAALELAYRRQGAAEFRRVVVASSAGRFEALVPGAEVESPALEYHMVVRDRAGAEVGRAGADAAPLITPVRPRPLTSRKWFWGALAGGAALVGALAAILAVALHPPDTTSLTIVPR
jgi:hypothetical protein